MLAGDTPNSWISPASFLEGPVAFTDWLACYTWAIICCRWHRHFWSIKTCLCHFGFSLSLSSESKPQPRQTGRHVHKCVVTKKNWLTHKGGHGHLLWPPDFRDLALSPQLSHPAVAGGLTVPTFIHKLCKAWSDSTNPASSLCCKTPLTTLTPASIFPYFTIISVSGFLHRLPVSHSWAPGSLSVVAWICRASFLQSLCPTLVASSSCCCSPSSPLSGRWGRPALGNSLYSRSWATPLPQESGFPLFIRFQANPGSLRDWSHLWSICPSHRPLRIWLRNQHQNY